MNAEEQSKGNQKEQWSHQRPKQETKVENDIKSNTDPDKEDLKRFENPSYTHGVRDSVVGSIKVRGEGIKGRSIDERTDGLVQVDYLLTIYIIFFYRKVLGNLSEMRN